MPLLLSIAFGLSTAMIQGSVDHLHLDTGHYNGFLILVAGDRHTMFDLGFSIGSDGALVAITLKKDQESLELVKAGPSWKYSAINLSSEISKDVSLDFGQLRTTVPDVPHPEFHIQKLDNGGFLATSDTMSMIFDNGLAVMTGTQRKDISRLVIVYWRDGVDNNRK